MQAAAWCVRLSAANHCQKLHSGDIGGIFVAQFAQLRAMNSSSFAKFPQLT